MAKLKDGFYKLTASSIGSDLLVLLAGGGAKPISDFAQFNTAYWANIPISNTSSTTTNPTFANITLSGKLTFTTAAATASISFLNGELIDGYGNVLLGTNSASWNVFNSSRSSLITVLKSGNVGIGTTSPIHKLHVVGAGIFNNTGSTTYASDGITIGAGDSAARYITCYGKTGASYINIGYNAATNNSGELHFYYTSSGSASNYVGLGLYGGANTVKIYPGSTTFIKPLIIPGELYSGNYGINMQNSDIIGINALYTSDNAANGTEGLQFSRGNGYYDSVWASAGVLYFSPNGNLNRNGSYGTNYTVIHSGNIGSQSVNYATSAGNADTVDSCHKDDFLRRTATLGGINKFVLEDIPKGVTQVGSIGWTDYQNHPHAGGLWMTLRGTSSLRTALILFPSYSMSSPPILYSSIDGGAWQGGYQLAYTSQIPTTMAWGNITGKPSTFTPSSHTHDDRYYTESEADSRFINHSGDTMTGPLTFANGTWNVVGDDAAIGDYNAAGMLGLKSINNNIPGIGFHNSSNTLLGRLQANGSNLLWNDNKIWHAGNDGSGSGLDADTVDGYHRSNLFTSYVTWMDVSGLNKSITVGGNADTYYPVVISVSSSKLDSTRISVWKNLGSTTPSYSGNHSNGTSSLWLIYEGRNWMWDGNGGFIKTWYKHQSYATLIAHAELAGSGVGNLVLYLRGGGCLYNIACSNSFTATVYTASTNIGSSSYPVNVAPRTTIGNGGIIENRLGYGFVDSASTATLASTVTVNNSDANSTYRMVWHSGNTLYGTGGIYCNPSTDCLYASHYYETSDIAFKTNIEPILNSDNMPVLKSFDWKSDGSHSYGLIALELEDMGYPELVSEGDGYKTVNYSAALSLIVGKLQVKIKELEKEIEILKNKN